MHATCHLAWDCSGKLYVQRHAHFGALALPVHGFLDLGALVGSLL